jgi:predicted nucleotidyltransferase
MGIIDYVYEKRIAILREIREKALLEAKKIARLLGEKFGAEEVILYGSLSRGEQFDMTSDIDLVVKGLGEKYLRAYGYCLRLTQFDLDIRVYEDMPTSWREKVKKEGKVLYAKR